MDSTIKRRRTISRSWKPSSPVSTTTSYTQTHSNKSKVHQSPRTPKSTKTNISLDETNTNNTIKMAPPTAEQIRVDEQAYRALFKKDNPANQIEEKQYEYLGPHHEIHIHQHIRYVPPPFTNPGIPTTKTAFIEAVTEEQNQIETLKLGFEKYATVISSEEHTTFPEKFLTTQTSATLEARRDLEEQMIRTFTIKEDARQIPDSTDRNQWSHHEENIRMAKRNLRHDQVAYYEHLCKNAVQVGYEPVPEATVEQFAAVQDQVAKYRKILRDAHVVYKINYALASDKPKAN